MAAVTPPLKKRCWGRSNREKISIIENMELEIPDKRSNCTPNPSGTAKINTSTEIDLQHPELLSTAQLANLLTERRVPLPVYGDGSYSRERLLFLFRKHIVPRPQRKRIARKGTWRSEHYESAIYSHSTSGETTEGMEWTNEDPALAVGRGNDPSRTQVKEGRKGDSNGGALLGKRKSITQHPQEDGQQEDGGDSGQYSKRQAPIPNPLVSLTPNTTQTSTTSTSHTTVRRIKRPISKRCTTSCVTTTNSITDSAPAVITTATSDTLQGVGGSDGTARTDTNSLTEFSNDILMDNDCLELLS